MPSVSYVCPMFLFYNSIIVVMYAFVNGIVYLYKRLYMYMDLAVYRIIAGASQYLY